MIYYHQDERVFHIQTKKTSYIMKVLKSGHVTQLYYGRQLRPKKTYQSLNQQYSDKVGGQTSYSKEVTGSLQVIPLEFSTSGKSDYREAALNLMDASHNRTFDFVYAGHQITQGKDKLPGLPSAHYDKSQGDLLTLRLKDRVKDIEVVLFYGVMRELDLLFRSVKIVNNSKEEIILDKVASMQWDHRQSDFDLTSLEGQWIRERHLNRQSIQPGKYVFDSKKGVSSSSHNPFLALAKKGASENAGSVYGFSLLYSGSHESLVEVSPEKMTRVQLGIQSIDFNWHLDSGASFQSPEVVMTYSDSGYNGMSQNLHQWINEHYIAPYWRRRHRPVLINNWEATYFNFDDKKIIKLAKEAKDLGIELFVLDDGWFENRWDDTSGLGDWKVDRSKLKKGLKGLADQIHAMDLQFGLWVEPEMVNEGSQLMTDHPDWVIQVPGRSLSPGRNQYILDLANPAVVDYLYKTLERVFQAGEVDYIKWDMNRNFSDPYSSYLDPDRQQELGHRYVLGLYALLDRLTQAFPKVLFESCASGGNRFDLGMLYYMPQTWTSDNTDAGARYKIQYGTSYLYPLSTMGAHVSGAPSHQLLRKTPIETRFNVAAFGLLGYELDLTKCSYFEKAAIKAQVAYYKVHRDLFQFGRFYRLKSPFNNQGMHWMVVNGDQSQAMVGEYQQLQEASPSLDQVQIRGLDPEKEYHLTQRSQYLDVTQFGELIDPVQSQVGNHDLQEVESVSYPVDGDQLLYAGLRPLNQFMGAGLDESTRFIGDFGSRLYYLEEKRLANH